MTRRSRRPLRSDLTVSEKTTKDEGKLVENTDHTTKDWCKVLNENSLVPGFEQSIFRLDHMLFKNVNMATTERYKFRSGNIVKEDNLANSKHSYSSEKLRTRKGLEDLEAKGNEFSSNSFKCDDVGGGWKEGSCRDRITSRRNSLNLAMTVSSGSNLPTVENLYMELQNGESTGESFVDPSSVAQKNGKCSSRLLDSESKVEALYKVFQQGNVRNSYHELDCSSTDNEENTLLKNTFKPAITKSYPRRNGICYRRREGIEDTDSEETRESPNTLAVVRFVDENSVTQNCVASDTLDEDSVSSRLTTAEDDKECELIQPNEKGDLSLPPKRQRRPPQSYSPSSSHGCCKLRKTTFPTSLKKRTALVRSLPFTEDERESKEQLSSENMEITTFKKKVQDKKKEKVKTESQPPVGQSCAENVSYVLGVRRLYSRKTSQVSQVLVQFKDGTSNWVPSTMLKSLHSSLGEFFTDSQQKLHVINRLPFNMYLTRSVVAKKSKAEKMGGQPDSATVKSVKTSKPMKQKSTHIEDTDVKRTSGETETNKDSCIIGLSKNENDTKRDTSNLGNTTCSPLQSGNSCFVGYKTSLDPIRSGLLNNILSNVQRTPSQTTAKEIEVTKHDTFVHIIVRCKHASHRNKRINPEICDGLVEHLEHYSVDDSVKLVVISGLEDHFSTKVDLLDVSRLPSWMEGHECKQSVLKLRYLFQTVRHYCKPLIAVINHPSRGLSASFLSLFDMVFDKERGAELFEPSTSKDKELSVLFPRLMGLAAKSEQLLMGEHVDRCLEGRLSQTEVAFRGTKYTYNLTESMKDIKGNLRKRQFTTSDSSKDSPVICSMPQESSPTLSLQKKRLIETDYIKKQIEREKELAQSCLHDISLFWSQVRNREVDEVLS